MKDVYFLGVNSHGADYPWKFFLDFILSKSGLNRSVAIAFECASYDILLSDIFRLEDKTRSSNHFHCWWMKSMEVNKFITDLELEIQADIYGVDISEKKINMDAIESTDRYKRCQFDLLLTDKGCDYDKLMDDYVMREAVMLEKLKKIIDRCYDCIFIICHNFHAAKKTWLHFKPVCQRLCEMHGTELKISSIGTFAKDMNFIAKGSDYQLHDNHLPECISTIDGKCFSVKMVSSYFDTEIDDVLKLDLLGGWHFDQIEIFEKSNALKVRRDSGKP